jgi:hypothetical protein
MKKTILPIFIVTLLFFSTLSMGQVVTLGAFGGLNSSKLSGDAPGDAFYSRLMGGNFGALIDLKLSESIYLSLQPSFSQEGTKVSYALRGVEEPVDSVKIRLNYFSLPLLVKITSTNQRFYALSGIETAVLLNASAIIEEDSEEISEVSQFNIAVHFGAGIRIPVGYPTIFVELRYSQGLVNLTDEALNTNIIPRVKTSGYKILVGVEFPLGKAKN